MIRTRYKNNQAEPNSILNAIVVFFIALIIGYMALVSFGLIKL